MSMPEAIAVCGIWLGWGISCRYVGIFSVITGFIAAVTTVAICK